MHWKTGTGAFRDPGGCIWKDRLRSDGSGSAENTKAFVVTHASNLTGNITDLARVCEIAEHHSLLLIVDAAQTAGILPIDVQKSGIDVLCFSGHKGLLGPQGTGGIYVRPELSIRPLKMGGSGIRSYEKNSLRRCRSTWKLEL